MRSRNPGERSLGFLETTSLARGVVCADAMVKTADANLVLVAPVSDGRMLVAVDGEVAVVEAALAKGIETAGELLVDALFIPNLHPDVPETLIHHGTRALGEALGLIETTTAAAAIRAADSARKTADIRLVRLRLAQGIGGKGFLQFTGLVADVEAGVAAAVAAVHHPEYLVGTEVIPATHPDLDRWLGRDLSDDIPTFDPPAGE